MVIDPGIRNVGVLVFERATGRVKLWCVRSLLPFNRVHLEWSRIPHAIRGFIQRNAIWFRCGLFCIESQFVARNVIQRVETCLQAYLEVLPQNPQVYVYPATKIRKGLGIPSRKDWAKNKTENVLKTTELLEDGPLKTLFLAADAKKKHNLADTFLPYYFFTHGGLTPSPPRPSSPGGASPCCGTT